MPLTAKVLSFGELICLACYTSTALAKSIVHFINPTSRLTRTGETNRGPQTVPKTVRVKENGQVGGEGQHGIDYPRNGGETGGICNSPAPTTKACGRGDTRQHARATRIWDREFGSEHQAARRRQS
jgi:hypothetical protein